MPLGVAVLPLEPLDELLLLPLLLLLLLLLLPLLLLLLDPCANALPIPSTATSITITSLAMFGVSNSRNLCWECAPCARGSEPTMRPWLGEVSP